jgi:ribonucleotide monophosphatase NagD (HAD superfamily)
MKIEGLKTLFIDIDGTLLHHHGKANQQTKFSPIVLPGVIEKLADWDVKGYRIILITGRKESEREATVKQLAEVGIQYDHLIMGVSRGDRVIINDMKPNSDLPTAIAINLVRNAGMKNIEI